MASSSDHEPKTAEQDRRSTSSPDRDDNEEREADLQPPTMGYPPAMGYPQPRYQQLYARPESPLGGYNSRSDTWSRWASNHKPAPTPWEVLEGTAVLAAIILLIYIGANADIPQYPEFKVSTLFVSNFNLSRNAFSANWEANLTVENPNKNLRLSVERIKSTTLYKDYILASSFVAPASLEEGTNGSMQVKLATNNSYQPWDKEMEQMRNDWFIGKVAFNLRLVMASSLEYNSTSMNNATIDVSCDDLAVEFAGAGTSGSMPAGDRNCVVSPR